MGGLCRFIFSVIRMDTVFLLWHNGPPDVEDSEMLIGVFRTEQDAKDAITAFIRKAGFCGLSG